MYTAFQKYEPSQRIISHISDNISEHTFIVIKKVNTKPKLTTQTFSYPNSIRKINKPIYFKKLKGPLLRKKFKNKLLPTTNNYYLHEQQKNKQESFKNKKDRFKICSCQIEEFAYASKNINDYNVDFISIQPNISKINTLLNRNKLLNAPSTEKVEKSLEAGSNVLSVFFNDTESYIGNTNKTSNVLYPLNTGNQSGVPYQMKFDSEKYTDDSYLFHCPLRRIHSNLSSILLTPMKYENPETDETLESVGSYTKLNMIPEQVPLDASLSSMKYHENSSTTRNIAPILKPIVSYTNLNTTRRPSEENETNRLANVDAKEINKPSNFKAQLNILKKMENIRYTIKINPNKGDSIKADSIKVVPKKCVQNKVYRNKVNPSKVDPNKVDRNKVDPNKVDRNKVELNKVDPNTVDPNKFDRDKVDLNKFDRDEVDPDKVDQIKGSITNRYSGIKLEENISENEISETMVLPQLIKKNFQNKKTSLDKKYDKLNSTNAASNQPIINRNKSSASPEIVKKTKHKIVIPLKRKCECHSPKKYSTILQSKIFLKVSKNNPENISVVINKSN